MRAGLAIVMIIIIPGFKLSYCIQVCCVQYTYVLRAFAVMSVFLRHSLSPPYLDVYQCAPVWGCMCVYA